MSRQAVLETLETRRLLSTIPTVTMPSVLRINFQTVDSPVPEYHRADTGTIFGRRANGFHYGWSDHNRINTRLRNMAGDDRIDSFTHMRRRIWEIAVPNGVYTVRLVAGDPDFTDSVYRVDVEGQTIFDFTPTDDMRFVGGEVTVRVTDGRLTVANAFGGANNKLSFIEIRRGQLPLPVVSLTSDRAVLDGEHGVTLTLSRSGPTDEPMTVLLDSSTTRGVLRELPSRLTFAAGQDTVTLQAELDDPTAQTDRLVRVAVVPQWHYSTCVFNSGVTISAPETTPPPGIAPPPDHRPETIGTLRWTRAASAQAARTEHMTAMVNDKLYLMGGYFSSGYPDGRTWLSRSRMDVYDPATNRWQRLPEMPQRLTHSGTAHDERYIYLAGGYTVDSTGLRQVIGVVNAWRYDTVTGQWDALPNLPQPMGAGSMVLVGRTLYHMGGFEGHITRDSSKIFSLDLDNLAAGWRFFGNMPETNNHFGVAVLDGYVYCMAGQVGNDATAVFKRSAWRWTPGTNQWLRLPNISTPGRSHTWGSTFAHLGRIFVIGGESFGNEPNRPRSVDIVEVYDPVTNSWSRNTSLPSARSTGSAVVWQGKIIFTVGMLHGVFKADTWIGQFV